MKSTRLAISHAASTRNHLRPCALCLTKAATTTTATNVHLSPLQDDAHANREKQRFWRNATVGTPP